MSFCKYGSQEKVGKGIYYICSLTNYPCKFARWCSSERKYKPNANFYSCSVRMRAVNSAPVIEEEVVETKTPEVAEQPLDAVIEETFEVSEEQPKRRRKKKVVETPETTEGEAE